MDKKYSIIITFSYIAAVLLVLYPCISSAYNGYLQQKRIAQYGEMVSEIDEDLYEEMIEEAIAWNEELYEYIEPSFFPEGMEKTDIYESLLNLNGDGMIGYIVIPKISVELPIYHYTTDEVLEKGAGHMSASALPVGGENTHCVITAHRGLPNALMFTNLDQIEIGDIFYTKVLDETFYYEVIEIQTVEPDETTSLTAVSGKDLCTLVTCTPYGVNSKRLLVTGIRTYDYEEEEVSDSMVEKSVKSYWFTIVIAVIETIVFVYFRKILKKGT